MTPIYITLFLVTLGHFIVDFMIGIWPVHKTMAELDLATAGIIAGSCAFVGEGAQLYFGGLADRGYRRFLIAAGILAATASVFLSYADDYAFLALLYLMTCLGSGAFHPSAVSLISRMALQHKTLFITIFAAGGALGLASSQLVFSHSHAFLEGKTAILAIPTLFLVLYIAFRSLYEPPIAQTLPANSKFKAIKQFFNDRNLTYLYISQVCSQTIAWAIIFLLPDVLQTKGYNSWICYGGGHLCFILGGAFMMIPGGYLAEKYSAKAVILIASIIGYGTFYCLLFAPPLSAIAIGALLLTFGASLNVINPISVAFGNRLMPTNPGTVSACLMGLALCVAEVLGPGGGGLLTKLFVEDAPIKALAILGLMFIPGLIAASMLPKNVTEPVPQTPTN
jgi:FSR family fosmidomycin resistance protein-like MFS transporter